jgi:hypothetical protein
LFLLALHRASAEKVSSLIVRKSIPGRHGLEVTRAI